MRDLTRVVAVDGPAGSGKSTVARLTAKALGWRFVDTGATYRAATLAVLRAGLDLTDTDAIATVAARADIDLVTAPERSHVRLNGADVSADIRGPEVTAAVSAVSAVAAVREHLIAFQRRAMGTEGAVVEGRDIATVVAPLAGLKVYLDARPEVRARRRTADVDTGVVSAGAPGSAQAQVAADLERRDALDNQTNKLKASDGAVHLDTSDLTVEEVVTAIVSLAVQAGLADGPVRHTEGDSRR